MRYCENCGSELTEGAKFCENCGAKVAEESVSDEKKQSESAEEEFTQQAEAQTVGGSGEIKLCPDGKYRWVYEFPMLKNPTIMFTVWKVLAISGAFPAILVFFINMSDFGFVEAIKSLVQVYGIMLAIFAVLSVIAYLILAAIYGGKYIVLFEMNEKEISHIQQDKQFKKAQGIAWLNMMAGGATGNIGRTGQGMMMATKNSSTSSFENVEEIIGLRGSNTIKVNQLLNKNQVYCDSRDYDFVYNYITSHCPKAKIK